MMEKEYTNNSIRFLEKGTGQLGNSFPLPLVFADDLPDGHFPGIVNLDRNRSCRRHLPDGGKSDAHKAVFRHLPKKLFPGFDGIGGGRKIIARSEGVLDQFKQGVHLSRLACHLAGSARWS